VTKIIKRRIPNALAPKEKVFRQVPEAYTDDQYREGIVLGSSSTVNCDELLQERQPV
jgi:hypothetical protein